MSIPLPQQPVMPLGLLRKGVIPAALLAALTSPLAYMTLERLEGNILEVYRDQLAHGIPTYCAGRTDWTAKPGTPLSSDQCWQVNKITLLEYGYAILGCVNWDHLSTQRLIALTLFAINVGKQAACGSQAVEQINRGQVAAGCHLIARTPDGEPNWSYADGQYVQGLQNRRQAERALCLQDGGA